MDRGADRAAARRAHLEEVLRSANVSKGAPLDRVQPDARGVVLLITGEARYASSDAYVASLQRVAASAGPAPEIVAVLAEASHLKGCRRATRIEKKDVVEAALARGLGSKRVYLRWYSDDAVLSNDVRRALAALTSPFGGFEVLEAAETLKESHMILAYGKLLVARGDLLEAERARGSQFARVVFLRPDAVYVGFSSKVLDASSLFVPTPASEFHQEQVAATPRPRRGSSTDGSRRRRGDDADDRRRYSTISSRRLAGSSPRRICRKWRRR